MKNRIINLSIALILFTAALIFNTFDTELNATSIGAVLYTVNLLFIFFAIINFNVRKWLVIEDNSGDERERYIKSLAKSKTLDILLLFLIPTLILSKTNMLDFYTVSLIPLIVIISYKYLYKFYSTKY